MNRDLFNNVDLGDASRATMALVDVAQDMDAHVAQVAAAALFLLLTEHNHITAQDAFAVTSNVMNHAQGRRPEFEAIAWFLREEFPK